MIDISAKASAQQQACSTTSNGISFEHQSATVGARIGFLPARRIREKALFCSASCEKF